MAEGWGLTWQAQGSWKLLKVLERGVGSGAGKTPTCWGTAGKASSLQLRRKGAAGTRSGGT